jgi:hypothetical protein
LPFIFCAGFFSIVAILLAMISLSGRQWSEEQALNHAINEHGQGATYS